jgi:hypothetical protein
MNSLQNIKIITAAQSGNTTQVTASVDTKGFGYALIIHTGSTAGTAGTNSKVEQSDDNSTWESMTGLVPGTDYTVSTGSIATTQPKFVLGFPLKGRKRYLKITAQGVSGVNHVSAILSDGSDAVSSATEAGVTNIFFR